MTASSPPSPTRRRSATLYGWIYLVFILPSAWSFTNPQKHCRFSTAAKYRRYPSEDAAPHPVRIHPLRPPFPNGPCGGRIVNLPPEDTFAIDAKLSGNQVLLPPREIQVWLPPEYDSLPAESFPVLYCHDGQNAMEDSSSWTGNSWRLMGAITRLSERGLIDGPPPIVVLLPSSEGDFLFPMVRRRHLEYGFTPIFAQSHADLVALTIKPLVDSMFRTKSESKHTFAIGSSLGGQASLHLVLRHPTIFGGAACLSPYFGPDVIASAAAASNILRDKRIYLDIGGDVGDERVPLLDVMDHLTPAHWWNPGYWWLDTSLKSSVDAMRMALQLGGVHHAYHVAPGGRHNERAWAQRIHLPLLHLFS